MQSFVEQDEIYSRFAQAPDPLVSLALTVLRPRFVFHDTFLSFHDHLSRPGQAKCALDYRKLAWLNSVDALLRLDEPTYTVVRTQSGGHDNKYGIVKSRQIGLLFSLKAR